MSLIALILQLTLQKLRCNRKTHRYSSSSPRFLRIAATLNGRFERERYQGMLRALYMYLSLRLGPSSLRVSRALYLELIQLFRATGFRKGSSLGVFHVKRTSSSLPVSSLERISHRS